MYIHTYIHTYIYIYIYIYIHGRHRMPLSHKKKLPRMLFGLWTVSFCKGGSKRNETAHCEALGRVRLALGESAGEMWRPKMYSPSAFTHARQKPRRVLKSPLGMPQRRAVDIFRPSRVLAAGALPRFLCKKGFFLFPGGNTFGCGN